MTHVDASLDKEVLSTCTKFLQDAVNTNLQQPVEYLHSFGQSAMYILSFVVQMFSLQPVHMFMIKSRSIVCLKC